MDVFKIINQIKEAMHSKGITPPENIIANGEIQRFHIEGDKRGSKNGWYVLYISRIACGVFGSWKEARNYKWCSKNPKKMSYEERQKFIQQIKNAELSRKKIHAKEQAEAAKYATNLFSHCPPADPGHNYLVLKNIKPFFAHQQGSYLVLPIVDCNYTIHSLQNISPHGEKWFFPNGAIKGHFIPIQHKITDKRRIIICEGFATGGALAHLYPEDCIIAACNAGNLKPVAANIRRFLPNSEIVIAADIDKIGLIKAREAARAFCATIIKPKFPSCVSNKFNDFNDLHCLIMSGGYQ